MRSSPHRDQANLYGQLRWLAPFANKITKELWLLVGGTFPLLTEKHQSHRDCPCMEVSHSEERARALYLLLPGAG